MLQLMAYGAVTTLVLFIPGIAVAWAARLRGLAMVAIAPAISVGILGMGAVLLAKLSLPYTPLSVAVLVVVAFGVMFALAWLLRRFAPATALPGDSAPDSRSRWGWTIAGIALGFAAALWAIRRVIPRPDLIHQGFDNLFHFNAVQWIVQHRDGSSLTLPLMTDAQGGFYPAGWHDIVATVLQLLPSNDVSPAINASVYVEVCLVWVIGLVYLLRVLVPFSRLALAAMPVFSILFPGFPMLAIYWGPLYPNLLSLCAVPAVLALVLQVFGVGGGLPRQAPGPGALAAVAGIAGVAIAHPNGVITLLVFLAPMLLTWAWRLTLRWRGGEVSQRQWLAGLGLWVVSIPATVAMWLTLRPPYSAAWWGAWGQERWAEGFGMALGQSGMETRAVSGTVTGLVAIGCYAAFRHRRLRWLVAIHAAVCFVFAFNYTQERSPLRYLLAGAWYCDANRVAIMVALTGIPLAMLGTWHLGQWATAYQARNRRLGATGWWTAPVTTALVGALSVGVIAYSASRSAALDSMRRLATFAYSAEERGDSVDAAEREVFRLIPSVVPADQRIATSPFNGSSMAYGATGRPTTTTHAFYTLTPDVALINDHLREAETNPAVCGAVRRLNVHWALDFGSREVISGASNPFPGLIDLAHAPGFTPRITVGDKVLYHVEACWS